MANAMHRRRKEVTNIYFIDTGLEYDAKNVLFRALRINGKAFSIDLKTLGCY